MNHKDKYETWKNGRRDIDVDPGFVDRVMRQVTASQEQQSSIARLEGGKSEPSLSFLRRVVEALGARLEVRIIPQEDVPVAKEAHMAIPISMELRS